MATSDIQATEMTSILDTIKNLIPSNPVKAFAEGNCSRYSCSLSLSALR